MADYYPLIARAVGGLSDRSPEMRKAVYDRARDALMGQLRSLEPPLPEATIEQERTGLEAAIARVEREQAPPAREPAPRPDLARPLPRAPLPPRDARAAPLPDRPAPETMPRTGPPAPAARPRADAPPDRPSVEAAPAPLERPRAEAPPPAPAAPRPRLDSPASRPEPELPPPVRPRLEPKNPPPAIALPTGTRSRPRPADTVARRPAVALAGEEPIAAEPVAESPLPESDPADVYAAPDGDQAVRPRVGTQAPLTVHPGRGRSLILGGVLVLVMGLIGSLAWTLRDRPDELPRPGAVAEAPPSRTEGAKIGERIGGPAPAPAAPTAPATPAPRPELNANPIAVFYEEDRTNPQAPKTTGGRVTWRTDALNAGQGQPLDTAIRATVEVPEAGFTLSLVIRRNLDATLPASHTVELSFATRAGDPGRVVRDVGVLQFRNDVNSRGTPVAGLPVPVRDNLFLIGLSNLPSDLERNMELLRRRNWIDLPIRMASGQRAIVSFEKGAPGEAVVADAVRQWQQ
ncbi:MAG TPA: histidine kinase [Microvirga sp.]|jgi:hypothetical protein|nr:histidine kinase [Microvirga sp.]